MVRLAALLLAGTMIAGPAFALESPPDGKQDTHIRPVAYSALNRTLLVGELHRSTTITFGAQEKIMRVTFGDDTAWNGPDPKEVASAPLGNNLVLWPQKTTATNMQVTTVLPGDGGQRVYQFALSAVDEPQDGSDDPRATFGLIFRYPAQERAAKAAAWHKRAEAWKARHAADEAKVQLAADYFGGPLNWRYTAKGDRSVAPWEVCDNGQFTAFRFPGNQPSPAIYAIGPDGTEQIAPFTIRDDEVIVQRTAREFRLRLGGAVLNVYNLGFNPFGYRPDTGTASPNVVRDLRADASQ